MKLEECQHVLTKRTEIMGLGAHNGPKSVCSHYTVVEQHHLIGYITYNLMTVKANMLSSRFGTSKVTSRPSTRSQSYESFQ